MVITYHSVSIHFVMLILLTEVLEGTSL